MPAQQWATSPQRGMIAVECTTITVITMFRLPLISVTIGRKVIGATATMAIVGAGGG